MCTVLPSGACCPAVTTLPFGFQPWQRCSKVRQKEVEPGSISTWQEVFIVSVLEQQGVENEPCPGKCQSTSCTLSLWSIHLQPAIYLEEIQLCLSCMQRLQGPLNFFSLVLIYKNQRDLVSKRNLKWENKAGSTGK